MLTEEQIEKVLLDHFDPLRTDGFSVLGGHAAKAAQAIYEAQGAAQEREVWVEVEEEDNNDEVATEYLQLKNGRLYRTRMWRNHAVALCFVPGEGCGERRSNNEETVNGNGP